MIDSSPESGRRSVTQGRFSIESSRALSSARVETALVGVLVSPRAFVHNVVDSRCPCFLVFSPEKCEFFLCFSSFSEKCEFFLPMRTSSEGRGHL